MRIINAKGIYYRNLNKMVRDAIQEGEKEITLKNVNGQYYIANGLRGSDIRITIEGVPGNDLCAFMDGPVVAVKSNGQDNIANTMNDGKVIIHGHAGDVLGYGMRGGKLFIRDDVGYRVGIHMKGYMDKIPVIIVGGTAKDFLGEYMAGGILIVLGLNRSAGDAIAGDYLGTGMHGGVMYIKGDIDPYRCGKEIGAADLDDKDMETLEVNLKEYCMDLGIDLKKATSGRFTKIYPKTTRPYGRLYAY